MGLRTTGGFEETGGMQDTTLSLSHVANNNNNNYVEVVIQCNHTLFWYLYRPKHASLFWWWWWWWVLKKILFDTQLNTPGNMTHRTCQGRHIINHCKWFLQETHKAILELSSCTPPLRTRCVIDVQRTQATVLLEFRECVGGNLTRVNFRHCIAHKRHSLCYWIDLFLPILLRSAINLLLLAKTPKIQKIILKMNIITYFFIKTNWEDNK